MATNERTLLLLKPDAVQRGLIGKILSRFEEKGLKVVGMKMLKMDAKLSKEHYAHIVSKPFYPDIERFMTHTPLIALVLEGKEVVSVVRSMMGPTNSRVAPSGSIRGDFSNSPARNLIHASDSLENAKAEIARFFTANELFDYSLTLQGLFYASDE